MIHSASYFQPENHRGILIPVSRTIPRRLGYEVKSDHALRELTAPSRRLLNWYKECQQLAYNKRPFPNHYIQRQYSAAYKAEIRPRIRRIGRQLIELETDSNEYTILCWEKQHEFCHRRLLMMCLFHWGYGRGQGN